MTSVRLATDENLDERLVRGVLLILAPSHPEDWRGRVVFLPLR